MLRGGERDSAVGRKLMCQISSVFMGVERDVGAWEGKV